MNIENQIPLHYAASNDSKEVGELFLSKGVDIDIKDIKFKDRKIKALLNIIYNK